MIGKDEGRAHPIGVDRCSLVRGEANRHGGAELKMATDTGGEYHPYVPSG